MSFSIVGSPQVADSASASTATITHGLTINSGDLLVAFVYANNSGTAISSQGAGSGGAWSTLHDANGSASDRLLVEWAIANGSEPSSVNHLFLGHRKVDVLPRRRIEPAVDEIAMVLDRLRHAVDGDGVGGCHLGVFLDAGQTIHRRAAWRRFGVGHTTVNEGSWRVVAGKQAHAPLLAAHADRSRLREVTPAVFRVDDRRRRLPGEVLAFGHG